MVTCITVISFLVKITKIFFLTKCFAYECKLIWTFVYVSWYFRVFVMTQKVKVNTHYENLHMQYIEIFQEQNLKMLLEFF